MDDMSYEEQVARARERVHELSPREAIELRDGSTVFLDVREPREWNLFRIPGAVHLPLGALPERVGASVPRDARVIVYCARGNRSALAAEVLQEMGYENVSSLSTGVTGWMEAGGELEQ